MEPEALARVCLRQRFGFFAAVLATTGVIGAVVLSHRMLSDRAIVPVVAVVVGVGFVVLFAGPLLLLRAAPPRAAITSWAGQIESRRRAGKPIRAFSTTFLVLVVAAGVVFAVALTTLMPLPSFGGR